MNRVEFCAMEIPLPPWVRSAGIFMRRVLKILELDRWDVSVLFCSNEYIRSLNSVYRKKYEPTDVLSFPLGETTALGRYLAGDIVVSLEALEENTGFFGVSGNDELRRLLVHGILHLAGDDHKTNRAGEPMLEKQEEILALVTERIL